MHCLESEISNSSSGFCLGQYTIEQIQARPDGTPSKIKVKVRLNRNGILDFTQAFIVETNDESEESTENKGKTDQNSPQNLIEPMEEVNISFFDSFR